MAEKGGGSNNTEHDFGNMSSRNKDLIDASSVVEISSKQNKEFARVETVLKSRQYQNYSDSSIGKEVTTVHIHKRIGELLMVQYS